MNFGETEATALENSEPPFPEWLKEINRQLGTDFSFDEAGTSSLVFQDGEQVWLQITGPNSLCIYAQLGNLPEPCSPEFLLAVLSLNAGHDPTLTGAVGFAPQLGCLVYSDTLLGSSSSALDLAIRIELIPDKLRSLRQLLTQFEEESRSNGGKGSMPGSDFFPSQKA